MKIPIQDGDDLDGDEREDTSDRDPSGGSCAASSTPGPYPSVEEAVPTEAEIRVQELEAELAHLTHDHHAIHEQLLRLGADFDNYRKRMARQFEDVKQHAAADLVLELLPGLDNLERALAVAYQDSTPSSTRLAEGVEMVLRLLKGALAKAGVRELQAHGQPFDPTLHEAAEVVRVPPDADGIVVEEIQRGYMMHGRLLRPAKVVVGKAEKDASGGGT